MALLWFSKPTSSDRLECNGLLDSSDAQRERERNLEPNRNLDKETVLEEDRPLSDYFYAEG